VPSQIQPCRGRIYAARNPQGGGLPPPHERTYKKRRGQAPALPYAIVGAGYLPALQRATARVAPTNIHRYSFVGATLAVARCCKLTPHERTCKKRRGQAPALPCAIDGAGYMYHPPTGDRKGRPYEHPSIHLRRGDPCGRPLLRTPTHNRTKKPPSKKPSCPLSGGCRRRRLRVVPKRNFTERSDNCKPDTTPSLAGSAAPL